MHINYRELLLRYMAHVIGVEGVSFVDNIGWKPNSIHFTPDEVEELEALEEEAIQLDE